jgi:hypothetical protein
MMRQSFRFREPCNGAGSAKPLGSSTTTSGTEICPCSAGLFAINLPPERLSPASLERPPTRNYGSCCCDPDWDGVLTAEDERGLTPLFWSHVLPYGEVKLDMNTRLALSGPAPA